MRLNSIPCDDLVPECGIRSSRKRLLQYSLPLVLLTGAMPSLAGVLLEEVFPAAQPLALTFTSNAGFNAALLNLSGAPSITSFDNVDAETPIANGSLFGGITYNLESGGELIVTDNFDTTSPFNYLGADDGFANEFLSGDELTFSFAGLVQAFGLFIIGSPEPGNVLPFDLQLVGGGLNVFNDSPEFTLDDGGDVFFLGIINESGFGSARLNSFGDTSDPFFAFNIDDITTVSEVPEPATLLLMVLGFVLLIKRSRQFGNKSQRGRQPSAHLAFKTSHQFSQPSHHAVSPCF